MGSKALKAFLLWALWALHTLAEGDERSIWFSALQSAGRTQCSFDPPAVSRGVRTRLDCSDQCTELPDIPCMGFNFKQSPPTCEFLSNITKNYGPLPDCWLYEFIPVVDACASSPCQHCGTCLNAANGYFCTCAPLFTGRQCQTFICDYKTEQGNPSQSYNFPDLQGKSAYCLSQNFTTYLVFQRRVDGSVYFYRNWTEYENGFGNSDAEFWLGNTYLAEITACNQWILHIDLMDWTYDTRYAEYDNCVVSDAASSYTLNSVGSYIGTAGDGMTYHVSYPWATQDQGTFAGKVCALGSKGAWWYNSCHRANLNGQYNDTTYPQGVNWQYWLGDTYSLKACAMMLRPFA